MRRPILFLFLLSVLLAPAGAQDLKELARDAKHSVVLLRVLDAFGREVGTGSGFFVDPEGLIVTNYHVVDKAHRIEAVLTSRRTLEVLGVVASDAERDLAVLKVGSGPFPALRLADSSRVEAGERIVVMGSPLGLATSLSEGIVANVLAGEELPHGLEGPALQITAAISPGSSGSPVMNFAGEVVGVAASQFKVGQSLNFAVPSSSVRELLAGIVAGAEPEPLGTKLATVAKGAYVRNLVISLVFFAAVYFGFRYLK